MNRAAQFRHFIKHNEPIIMAGAHDGISAHLAESAGFKCLFASGFCISTGKNVQDAGLITMTESLNKCREIHLAGTLPVIADVDDGFGDALNVKRMVREYETAGAAGICMEDNVHPKRNSLFKTLDHRLVSIDEFVKKIRVVKENQHNPDFTLIARIEAFIAGHGMGEVRKRAAAYCEAGADMLIIHSNLAVPDQLFEFSAGWDGGVPLAAVPSTFSETSADRLFEHGYMAVIFANQAFRASLKSMKNVYQSLVDSRIISSVEDQMMPLKEIYDLVDYSGID